MFKVSLYFINIQIGKYFKRLVGSKVYLSPSDPDDAEKMTKRMNTPTILAGLWRYGEICTLQQEKDWLSKEKECTLSIIKLENDELIGEIWLHSINHIDQTAELWIVIGEADEHNKWYWADAIKTLLRYAFYEIHLNNVFLRVKSFNKKAIHCYKKVGFRQARIVHQSTFYEGEFYDVILMEYLKEWFDENEKMNGEKK